MFRQGWWMAAFAVAAMVSGSAFAQDAYAAVGACDEEEVATEVVRGKATIELSGTADVAVWARHVEIPGNQHISATEFGADTAELTFKVTPTGFENNFLTMTLDLDDAWDGSFDQDDFLKELYFTFDNICNTGFGVKFGKMGIPYGYDKDELLVSPYLDGAGEHAWGKIGLLPSTVDAHPANVDETFAITPYYNLCDSLLIEASLFQRAGSRDINGRRRSNDNLLFKSMALAFTWTPCEDLTIKLSGITEYIDAGDMNHRIPGFTDRAYGISIAADYNFQLCGKAFNVFAEYQHGWNYLDLANTGLGGAVTANPGFWDGSKSDNIHFGFSTQLCDRLTFFAQGEWLQQKQNLNLGGGAIRANAKETAWRAVAALQYELASGIILEGGWQREWLKVSGGGSIFGTTGGGKMRLEADTVFAGVRYTF